MAVLQQCPQCHRRWAAERAQCGRCGFDLAKGRKSQSVPFYVVYRVEDGGRRRQVAEFAGYKLKSARASDGKRRGQVKENRILEILPEYNETWQELAARFLGHSDVKNKASYFRAKWSIDKFLETFGDRQARGFRPQDLLDWQEALRKEGYEPSTIHQNRAWVGAMVNRADDNGEIHPQVGKVFTKTKRIFKAGQNAKRRPLLVEEYVRLLDVCPEHLRNPLELAYNAPLRSTEPFALRWKHIDLKEGLIRIPEGLVKKAPARDIPINRNVRAMLDTLPRGLPEQPLFRYRGRSIREWPRGALKAACEKVGILYGDDKVAMTENGEVRGLCSRDIRPGVLSNMEAAGVGEKYQKYFAGHVQQGMDKHYFEPIRTRAEMDRYTAWLDAEMDAIRQKVVKSVVNDVNSPVSGGVNVS